MRSMGSMGSGPGFQSNSSSVSQPNRSSCCGGSFVSIQLPNGGQEFMAQGPNGRLRPLTAEEERELGLGNSSQYCPGPGSSRGSQASLNSSWVLPPGPIQNQGPIHLNPSRRVNQQQQDMHNMALNTTRRIQSGKSPAAEHAAGDPLWNTLGDWIQRTTSGRQVNMGQWVPYYRDKNGVERPVHSGLGGGGLGYFGVKIFCWFFGLLWPSYMHRGWGKCNLPSGKANKGSKSKPTLTPNANFTL